MQRLLPLTAALWTILGAAAVAQVPHPANGPTLQTVPSVASGIRLAVFSPQRAFSESADGKKAKASLTALQAEKTREIDARNKALDAQEQALEESRSVLGESARGQRAKEVEKFRIDLQRFIQDAQAELAGAQRDFQSAFLAKLRPTLDQVAKERGLHLVINEDVGLIAWADPSLDITQEVVKRLDQR